MEENNNTYVSLFNTDSFNNIMNTLQSQINNNIINISTNTNNITTNSNNITTLQNYFTGSNFFLMANGNTIEFVTNIQIENDTISIQKLDLNTGISDIFYLKINDTVSNNYVKFKIQSNVNKIYQHFYNSDSTKKFGFFADLEGLFNYFYIQNTQQGNLMSFRNDLPQIGLENNAYIIMQDPDRIVTNKDEVINLYTLQQYKITNNNIEDNTIFPTKINGSTQYNVLTMGLEVEWMKITYNHMNLSDNVIPISKLIQTSTAYYVLKQNSTNTALEMGLLSGYNIDDNSIFLEKLNGGFTAYFVLNCDYVGNKVWSYLSNQHLPTIDINKIYGYPADSSKYLRGDGQWTTISAGSDITQADTKYGTVIHNNAYLRTGYGYPMTKTYIQVYNGGYYTNWSAIENYESESCGIFFTPGVELISFIGTCDSGYNVIGQDEDISNAMLWNVNSSGYFNTVSSEKRKFNIREKNKDDNILERLLKLKIYSYGLKYDINNTDNIKIKQRKFNKSMLLNFGLIAQEVFNIFPNMITQYKNELDKNLIEKDNKLIKNSANLKSENKKITNINNFDENNISINYTYLQFYQLMAFQESYKEQQKINDLQTLKINDLNNKILLLENEQKKSDKRYNLLKENINVLISNFNNLKRLCINNFQSQENKSDISIMSVKKL